MAFQKNTTVEPATPAVAPAKPARDPQIRGQVAMHAAIAGYRVAAILAPTLANSGEGIKAKLHEIAAEVTAAIEAHTFND